jgi:hypothetical protein
MKNLTFYFQLSVSILIRKQQNNMPITAADKWRNSEKDLWKKVWLRKWRRKTETEQEASEFDSCSA